MRLCRQLLCLSLLINLLTACTSGHLAPVSEGSWHTLTAFTGQRQYIVKKGDTLYSIAFRYDTDYRHMAEYNHISPPYTLKVGQRLNIKGRVPPLARVIPIKRFYPKAAAPNKPLYIPNTRRPSASGWLWPVSGQIMSGFAPTEGRKGIDIACKKGDKILAAADGMVAYAGSGLAGYGNLIIIKHNNAYLTAYGNTSRSLVSEGAKVRRGQVIAEVGVLKHRYWGLHFEIRRQGNPVNPLNYLR